MCTNALEQGSCLTHVKNPCVRSKTERERPEFPQSYFGVIFVTDAFCNKDGCEGRIVVSEKYRDNKQGGRSREDLVMGLTQHMTVIIMPEDNKWIQVTGNAAFYQLVILYTACFFGSKIELRKDFHKSSNANFVFVKAGRVM